MRHSQGGAPFGVNVMEEFYSTNRQERNGLGNDPVGM